MRSDCYDSNETLDAKVLIFKSGYDLTAPSIANVGLQIKAGAYQKIDKAQIPHYGNIDKDLLKMMEAVDPGNEYAVPYFRGINTLAINTRQVQKALGTDKLPENEWDLVFSPEYSAKLISCGIIYFDSAIEQIPLVLLYLGKDCNSENPEDIKAAVDMMNAVRGDVKCFSSSLYVYDYGGCQPVCLHRLRRRFEYFQNPCRRIGKQHGNQSIELKICVGVWLDSYMIPRYAQNVTNSHRYIDYTLLPGGGGEKRQLRYLRACQPFRARADG